jgi:endonuclease/exonuclease/phosphatase family metal-dependent hydrolase
MKNNLRRPKPNTLWTTSSSPEQLPSGAQTGSVRLVSYNIHIGIGRDGVFAPERIAAVLQELAADVIALQEVPLGPEPYDMLDFLQTSTGMHALAAPTLVDQVNGAYGNALLTRHPVLSSQRLDISVPRCQPRGAIDVSLDCRLPGFDEPLRVIGTHLGLRPAERRLQVPRLLDAIDERDKKGITPTVLLGDINEWFLWGRPLRWLHAHFRKPRPIRTFPSGCPLFALDRIWVRPSRLIMRLGAHRSALSRVASDHLPLVADLRG